jgi:hypothetical protein
MTNVVQYYRRPTLQSNYHPDVTRNVVVRRHHLVRWDGCTPPAGNEELSSVPLGCFVERPIAAALEHEGDARQARARGVEVKATDRNIVRP